MQARSSIATRPTSSTRQDAVLVLGHGDRAPESTDVAATQATSRSSPLTRGQLAHLVDAQNTIESIAALAPPRQPRAGRGLADSRCHLQTPSIGRVRFGWASLSGARHLDLRQTCAIFG